MGNIEKRLERLENRERPVPEKLMALLRSLISEGNTSHLGPNATLEEVLAALRRDRKTGETRRE